MRRHCSMGLCFIAVLFGGACTGNADSPKAQPRKVDPAVEVPPQPDPEAEKQKMIAEKMAKLQQEKAELRTFAKQFERAQTKLDNALKLKDKNPRANTGYKKAAAAYLAKARLTGDYTDYAEAEKLIDKTFTLREGILGDVMGRASLNYTLHRLDRVDEDFAMARKRPGKNDAARAADHTFAANLAMQRGQYEKAGKHYDRAVELRNNASVKSARAMYLWKLGKIDDADALLAQTIEDFKGKDTEPVAWMHLHRGLFDLDRGRLDDALAHYAQAKSWIDGYWLIDEHVAEVLTLQGKNEEAKAMYLDIIERTNNPEFMDAMAGLLFEEGKDEEARQYVARADKRYQEQMALYPEAAYGHALGHYIEFGENPARTVELAEKNHTLRPNSEAKTLLAQAYLKAGQTKRATKIIDQAVATPYSTIDLHLTAAEVYRAAGQDDLSAQQLDKAKTIDPGAELPPLEPPKPADG